MVLPFRLSFLVPGISKCGTTSFCAMLAQHPQIFIPEQKEPNYFALPFDEMLHTHYVHIFNQAPAGRLLGEGSQLYTTYKHEISARNRILEHNPEIKLIFLVRHPLKRIESSYKEFHHSGPNFGLDAPFSIKEAIEQLPGIIYDTQFWQRISCYLERVPKERVLIIFLEDLKTNLSRELRRCFAFIGVDSNYAETIEGLKLNPGNTKLYDSRLLRAMRLSPHIGYKLARIPISWQNRIFRRIGLRRTFRKPLHWEPDTKAMVIEKLRPDINNLLTYCGKAHDFWPEFAL